MPCDLFDLIPGGAFGEGSGWDLRVRPSGAGGNLEIFVLFSFNRMDVPRLADMCENPMLTVSPVGKHWPNSPR